MVKGEFFVSIANGKVWSYRRRACGDPAATPLHEVLAWILEQINLGNWHLACDSEGRGTTLTIGQAAAADVETSTIEEVAKEAERRLLVVNLVGILAKGREQGVEPQHADLAETVRMTATEAAYTNTEFHYAFELVSILERIRASTFVFTAPPIKGVLGDDVVGILREATRAYLFGLHRSCVSLCRALIEATLRERADPTELLNERFQSKKGELECLINVVARRISDKAFAGRAHNIRKAGNDALHGPAPADTAAWGVLLDTRAVVEAVSSLSL
jgi:hypothetical protein